MSVYPITISDLLSLSRPLTGATSLSPSSCSPPLKKHKLQPPQVISENLTNLLLPDNNTNRELFFTPLNFPVLLVGIVDLPTDPFKQFLSISDGSSTICCVVLDFDLNIIGCRIHVLAWNFIPFKRQGGGLLEVIRWSNFSSPVLSKDTSVISVQKAMEFSTRKCIVGVLKSVSPVFTVPCRNQGSGMDLVGFLTDICKCMCHLCSKSFSLDCFGCSLWKQNSHCFISSEFVYFVKPSSGWRLALAKLVGKIIMVTGLTKKMIYVGEKTSYAMCTTTYESSVSFCRFPLESIKLDADVWARMIQETTVYNGVVTGVYMQGMAIELDEKVWLLVTDPNLVQLEALRVGAIISVRNFELVRPVLSCIETNLLVSYCRTTIDVKVFSLSDTRCQFRSQSQSLLRSFIESLLPTARFWVLLLISCFRRKFDKILSNKEILGSRNKEGFVQIYAHASLLPDFFQPQHGVFMEFCQNSQSATKDEKNKTTFKLVVPISNLIRKCEMMWASLVKEMQCDDEKLSIGGSVSCEGTPSIPIIRRIISSDILGCILMGSIKSTSSGKLQLFDATGSVDIVVPDIISSFHCQGIHEVKVFKIVIEGPSMQLESSLLHCAEPLSCRNIFGELPVKKKINQLLVYAHFYLKDSTCLNAPINLPLCTVNDCNTNVSRIAHLLLVTHKFPAGEIYEVDANALNRNSFFAEALLLPYEAIFLDVDAHSHGSPAYASQWNNKEMKCSRKPKFVESSLDSLTHSNYDLDPSGMRPGFHCLLNFAKSSHQINVAGYLCHKGGFVLENKPFSLHRILLEFISDSFIKYQSLLIGGYYIIKCSKECPLCFPKAEKKLICAKIILSSKTSLWKVSFSFDMAQPKKEQPRYQTSGDNSIRSYQTCLGSACQNDLIFQQLYTQLNDHSDIQLHISHDMPGSLNQIKAFEGEIFSKFSMLQEVLTVSSVIQIMKSGISMPLKRADSQNGSLFNTKLISVCGNIESMHFFNCNFGSFLSNENVARSHMREHSICLHVYDDQNMIHIRGKLNNFAYPVGLGPGVNATFHRVHVKCSSGGFPKLVLTSVSLIIINYVKETSFLCRKKSLLLPQFDRNSEDTHNSVSLSLVSQFVELLDIKLTRLLCRVVTIHFIVFEILELEYRGSGSRMKLKMPSIKIPLAGLLLDDGSSLCYCLADAKRAEMLLRLDKISCQPFFQGGVSSLKGNVGYQDTVGYQLDKILQKHHKIIMKNYRAVPEASYMDIMFHVDSSEIFSNAEESLLRFIISNACQGSAFNITGHWVDSTILGSLPLECEELKDIVQPLPKFWAEEIEHINSLKQARDLLDELSTG